MFLIIFYAKFKMALWRVLGIDKCGSLRAPQPSIRHAKDNTENQTERRGGAEPSPLNRSGDGCRFFRRAMLSYHWFLPFIVPLEFAFSVGYGSIVPRGRQRPQNRRLKHL